MTVRYDNTDGGYDGPTQPVEQTSEYRALLAELEALRRVELAALRLTDWHGGTRIFHPVSPGARAYIMANDRYTLEHDLIGGLRAALEAVPAPEEW